MNVVTVGARHRDTVFDGTVGPMSIDPYHLDTLPNVTSALGTGAGTEARNPDEWWPRARAPKYGRRPVFNPATRVRRTVLRHSGGDWPR